MAEFANTRDDSPWPDSGSVSPSMSWTEASSGDTDPYNSDKYSQSHPNPVYLWLPTNILLKQFNDHEIGNQCLRLIVNRVYGGPKEFIKYLVKRQDEVRVNYIYDLLKQEKLNNYNNDYDDYKQNNNNKSYFNILSTSSITNICSYLTKSDILQFKATSSVIAIICLNEMKKSKIGIFNMNQLLYINDYKHLSLILNEKISNNIIYNRYKLSIKFDNILQIWSKQYNININNMLLFRCKKAIVNASVMWNSVVKNMLSDQLLKHLVQQSQITNIDKIDAKTYFYLIFDKSKMKILYNAIDISKKQQAKNDFLNNYNKPDFISCSSCTFNNKLDNKFCKICGNSLIKPIVNNSKQVSKLVSPFDKSKMKILYNNSIAKKLVFVICSLCTFKNKSDNKICEMCNNPLIHKSVSPFEQQRVICLYYFDLKKQTIQFLRYLLVSSEFIINKYMNNVNNIVSLLLPYYNNDSSIKLFDLIISMKKHYPKISLIKLYKMNKNGEFYKLYKYSNHDKFQLLSSNAFQVFVFQITLHPYLTAYIQSLKRYCNNHLDEIFCTTPSALVKDLSKKLKLRMTLHVHSNAYNNHVISYTNLSSVILTNICSFLSNNDICSFKLISRLSAITALSEMKKITIGSFNFNSYINSRNNNYKLNIKISDIIESISMHNIINYTRYKMHATFAQLLQDLSLKYSISLHNMILFKSIKKSNSADQLLSFCSNSMQIMNDLYLQTNNSISSFKNSVFLLFDLRKLNPISSIPLNSISSIRGIILLNYFDITTQSISRCSTLIYSSKNTISTLYDYINNNISQLINNKLILNILSKMKTNDQSIIKQDSYLIYSISYNNNKINNITTEHKKCKLSTINDTNYDFKIITFQINTNHLVFQRKNYLSKIKNYYVNCDPYHLSSFIDFHSDLSSFLNLNLSRDDILYRKLKKDDIYSAISLPQKHRERYKPIYSTYKSKAKANKLNINYDADVDNEEYVTNSLKSSIKSYYICDILRNKYVSSSSIIDQKYAKYSSDRNKSWIKWTKILHSHNYDLTHITDIVSIQELIDFARLSLGCYSNWLYMKTNQNNWNKCFCIIKDFNLFFFNKKYDDTLNLNQITQKKYYALALSNIKSVSKYDKLNYTKEFYLVFIGDNKNNTSYQIKFKCDSTILCQSWIEEIDYQIAIVSDLCSNISLTFQYVDNKKSIWIPFANVKSFD